MKPDVVPSGGKGCLVSRIENVATKEYYEFKYDANGRVTQVMTTVLYSPYSHGLDKRPTDWKYLNFTYSDAGLLTEARLTYGNFFGTGHPVTYRFTYNGGKLVEVATREDGDTPYAELVKVNENN